MNRSRSVTFALLEESLEGLDMGLETSKLDFRLGIFDGLRPLILDGSFKY